MVSFLSNSIVFFDAILASQPASHLPASQPASHLPSAVCQPVPEAGIILINANLGVVGYGGASGLIPPITGGGGYWGTPPPHSYPLKGGKLAKND